MDSSHESAPTGEDGPSQPDSQFVFVTDVDRRFIRSRLMRDSWSKRNERNSRKPLKKRILPAKRWRVAGSASRSSKAAEPPATGLQTAIDPADLASLMTSFGISTIESSKKVLDFRQQSKDTIYPELESEEVPSNEVDEQNRGSSRSSSESLDDIPSFEVANFDPFGTLPASVRPFDHALIHHWINVFGTMMFGKPRSSIDPMAEVWIPEALSNEASFQGMLSYAAAHLAHLSGRDSGVRGTMYKVKSITAIQKLLNNDQTMLSDSTVAAILRQISIEDRFGNPEIASLHRAGLEKIIEKRGGRIRGNWRLELLLHWYLITSRPKFQHRKQTTQEDPDDSDIKKGKEASKLGNTDPIPGLSAKIAKLFDFFQELRLLTTVATKNEGGDGMQLNSVENRTWSANRLLYLFKNSPGPSRGPTHDIVEETCRLSALFYLAAIKADSLRFGTSNFQSVMNTVNENQSAWEHSLEMLLWVLLRGNGLGLENPETVQRVLSYMEVAKLLQKESWNVLKEMLIGFLCDDPRKAVGIYEESMLFVADLMRIRS